MDSSSSSSTSRADGSEHFGEMIELRRDSSSRDTLSKLFGEIIEWRVMFLDEVRFQWTDVHLTVVRDYVLKLDLTNSRSRTLRAATLFNEPLWYRERHSLRNYLTKVAFFTKELREFFTVPRPRQISNKDNALEEHELLAVFINFLLQLLSHQSDHIVPVEEKINSLEKDLRFLFTVVGDVSLLCAEQNLLAEFEAVANEAGNLVHSLVFSMDLSFRTMKEGFDALFNHIGLLNNNIIQLSALPPSPVQGNNYKTPKMVNVDSLFIVESFLYDLEDLLNRNEGLIFNVKIQIETLHQDLGSLMLFFNNIKMALHSEMEGQLKEAETRIRDVAYEAEYVIVSFFVGDAPVQYFSNRLSHVMHKINIVKSTWLQEISKDHQRPAGKQPVQSKKYSHEADDNIVGFEENAMHILDRLVGDAQNREIISICGMPGLGKTTIARELYNHPIAKHRFDRRSWCTVSQTYQRRNVLIDILITSSGEFDKARILKMEEWRLGELIYKSLSGRRYLIVLDDVWDSKLWDDLWRFFPNNVNGSRILFTSRNNEVAPPGSKNYPLSSLTDDHCWELLKKKVFQDEPCPPELLGIGKKIAANCGGLPLAVVVVAGILSTLEKKQTAWKERMKSFSFSSGNNVMQILGLSYKYLPEHLKPCFLYFGAFPEDTEIPARKLMRLWIAEGFVRKELGKSSESVAEEYLMELIEKSLIIVAKRRTNGGVKACLIHDLLRDFCLKICEGEYFLQFVNNNYSLYEKGHRLLSPQSSATPFGQHVRSFHGYLLDTMFYVRNMRLLRVLDFKRMHNRPSLIGIEFLIQLRYLVINELSALIAGLVNLEYLRVENNGTVRIPSEVLKMVKLKLLQINREAIFEDDCSNSQMSNLEVISNIIIKKQKDEEILKGSSHLRKLKCTCQPLSEGRGANRCLDLRLFVQLESLTVKFSRYRKGEIMFPSNVVKLTLSGMCLPWEEMSIIGRLPCLKVLKLGSSAFVGETWEITDGEFQQLLFLKLEMLDLAEWFVYSGDHFSRLERLVMYFCWNLKEIPKEIGEISTLQVIEIQSCSEALEQSAMEIQEEQREQGNDDIMVIFSHLIPHHTFHTEMMSLESSLDMTSGMNESNTLANNLPQLGRDLIANNTSTMISTLGDKKNSSESDEVQRVDPNNFANNTSTMISTLGDKKNSSESDEEFSVWLLCRIIEIVNIGECWHPYCISCEEKIQENRGLLNCLNCGMHDGSIEYRYEMMLRVDYGNGRALFLMTDRECLHLIRKTAHVLYYQRMIDNKIVPNEIADLLERQVFFKICTNPTTYHKNEGIFSVIEVKTEPESMTTSASTNQNENQGILLQKTPKEI